MIRIKCGTCGTSQGYKTVADGRLTLPCEEEARLVFRGVADYVTKPILNTAPDAGAPAGEEDESGADVTLPDNGNSAAGAIENNGNIPAYSIDMRADYLRSLLKQHDIPCKVGMSKAEMVAALDEVFNPVIEGDETAAEDSEIPPELGAEEPVV